MPLLSIGIGWTIRFCLIPWARMLASSARSSAAVAGVLRTLLGERTSWLRAILRILLRSVMAGTPGTGGRETSLALENPSQIPSRPSSSVAFRRDRCGGGEGAAAAWGRSLVLFRIAVLAVDASLGPITLGPITGGFGGHATVALRLLCPRSIDAWSSARSSCAMRMAIATIRAVCGAFARWPRGGWQKWVGPRRNSRSQATSVARQEH